MHAHFQIQYYDSEIDGIRETLSGFDPNDLKSREFLHASLDEFLNYLASRSIKEPGGWEGKDGHHFTVFDGAH